MARIIIVDDSSMDRYILRKCLMDLGHDVVCETTNQKSTLLAYKTLRPDVVMIDIFLQSENGINLLEELMAIDKKANIIMCTSNAIKNNIINAVQIGAKHFLVKPIATDSLNMAIKKALVGSLKVS